MAASIDPSDAIRASARLERLTDGVADTNSLAGWSLFQTRFELERLLPRL